METAATASRRTYRKDDPAMPGEFRELLVKLLLDEHLENNGNPEYRKILANIANAGLRFAPDSRSMEIEAEIVKQEVHHGKIVAELIDTEVYAAWVRKFGRSHQWGRVLASNAVALPIDSVVFVLIAFSGIGPLQAVVPTSVVMEIIWLNIVFKGVVTVLSIPLIYAFNPEPVVAD